MVGKRSWTMEEIVWILDQHRLGHTYEELYDGHAIRFPKSNRRASANGIRYVWDKYKNDPSFNQDFPTTQVAFILGDRSRLKDCNLEDILQNFDQEFSNHEWPQHVDKQLAIESAIARNRSNPKYAFPKWFYTYGHERVCDEARFVLRAKTTSKSWEIVRVEFKLRWPEKEVSLCSLQYLHARHRLYFRKMPLLELELRIHDEWSSNYEEDQWSSCRPTLAKRAHEHSKGEDQRKRKRPNSSVQKWCHPQIGQEFMFTSLQIPDSGLSLPYTERADRGHSNQVMPYNEESSSKSTFPSNVKSERPLLQRCVPTSPGSGHSPSGLSFPWQQIGSYQGHQYQFSTHQRTSSPGIVGDFWSSMQSQNGHNSLLGYDFPSATPGYIGPSPIENCQGPKQEPEEEHYWEEVGSVMLGDPEASIKAASRDLHVPKYEDHGEAGLARPEGLCNLFGSNLKDSEILEPALEMLSGLGDLLTEYGIPEVLGSALQMDETQIPDAGNLAPTTD